MPWVGFEPTISAGERQKTYALDRTATGTGICIYILSIYRLLKTTGMSHLKIVTRPEISCVSPRTESYLKPDESNQHPLGFYAARFNIMSIYV